jgi:oxygen-dependent protoporphyrinogen oxidase
VIAVVGGGISGLALGYRLAAAGAGVTVFEAAPRPGGVIESRPCGDRVLELGPQRTRLTPPLRRLAGELGLTDDIVTAPRLPLLIYTDGRLRRAPTDVRSVLTTDLISWPDRLRALLEPLTPGMRPAETAADFFTRKFGRRTYERVIAPLFGGLFASDPADMHARHALASMLSTLRVEGSLLRAMGRGLRAGSTAPACSFSAGLQALTDALAGALGDRLRLATPVHAVRRTAAPDNPGGRSGGARRFVLETDDGTSTADAVVLACPSAAAARILEPLDPDAAGRLARLRFNRLATVHLESDARLGAMGYQVVLDEARATHGVTSRHDLFGETGLYTAFMGGSRRPDVAELEDGRLGELAAAEFRDMTGAEARVIHVHRTGIPAWDASWSALDDFALPDGVHACAGWADRPGITGRLVHAERLAARLLER